MKITRPLFVVLCVTLSACATTKEKDMRANCHDASCTTTVTVHSCSNIAYAPEPIVVGEGSKPHMTWTIVTRGWKFTDNGIDILKPDGEFHGKLKESDTVFKWKNKHTKSGNYKYDIYVTDGIQVCKKDPTIVNL